MVRNRNFYWKVQETGGISSAGPEPAGAHGIVGNQQGTVLSVSRATKYLILKDPNIHVVKAPR